MEQVNVMETREETLARFKAESAARTPEERARSKAAGGVFPVGMEPEATAAEQTEFMGFRVEWKGPEEAPAIFHGKRGACYGAFRCKGGKGEWCFLMDLSPNHGPAIRRIHGNGWVRIPLGTRQITGAQ